MALPINCYIYHNDELNLVKNFIQGADLTNLYYIVALQIGDYSDKASDSYIKGKKKDCEYVGVRFLNTYIDINKDGWISYLCQVIRQLNKDQFCAGIMLEIDREVMKKFPSEFWQFFYDAILPIIDIDGCGSFSNFHPCTATGTINLLKSFIKIDLKEKLCTVIGRSKLVGKPITDLLIQHGATVTSCNSFTSSNILYNCVKNSDIIISAVGKANLLKPCMFDSEKNQILIDIGTSFVDGKLVGDVDPAIYKESYDFDLPFLYYTPVPKGMGLVTRAVLMQNVVLGISNREKEVKNKKREEKELENFKQKFSEDFLLKQNNE